MEEQPVARVQVGGNKTNMNRCMTFENEIEKVELRRQELMEELQRNKRQMKQNCKFYISKKQIIPSTFEYSSCHQPSAMKIFNARSPKFRNQIYSEHSNMHELSTNSQNEKQDVAEKAVTNKIINEDKQIQRWRIEINSEELNSLFFGKELKIGEKYRQKYMSDDKLRQMKKNIIRSKSRQNTIYHKEQKRQKAKDVDFIRKKNTKSQCNLMTNLLSLGSMKKARKYHPLGPFLVNDLIGETRKNMRYSKRELA